MDTDDILEGLFAIAIIAFAVLGVIFTFADYRHFSKIEKQCAEHGRIQDANTRINCQVEPKSDKP